MVARVPLPAHRLWWDAEGAEPADGSASYSVRLVANREGADAEMNVRLALYHFDDLNPTEDPESIVLDEIELPVALRDNKRELFVDIPASAFEPIDGVVPNAVLPYLSLSPPDAFETKVWVWDFSIVEWRAAEQGQGYQAIDWVRGTGECGNVVVHTISM
jgi:hypothetical protein